jgi:hypothetical protein
MYTNFIKFNDVPVAYEEYVSDIQINYFLQTNQMITEDHSMITNYETNSLSSKITSTRT